MGIFGWSYPPGCNGPPDDDYDDTVCAFCGTELDPINESNQEWIDEGFCSNSCKTRQKNGEIYEDDLPTVSQFCEHIGISPLHSLLRAIDKYNIEAVDIMVSGDESWYGPDDNVSHIKDDQRIYAFRVRGIARDASDWEYGEIVYGTEGLQELDKARERFLEALEEYEAERDANATTEDD